MAYPARCDVRFFHDGRIEVNKKIYVPERTCKMKLIKRGPIYTVWRFSCCGYEHSENNTDRGATGIPETVCPKCGTKVEK